MVEVKTRTPLKPRLVKEVRSTSMMFIKNNHGKEVKKSKMSEM